MHWLLLVICIVRRNFFVGTIKSFIYQKWTILDKAVAVVVVTVVVVVDTVFGKVVVDTVVCKVVVDEVCAVAVVPSPEQSGSLGHAGSSTYQEAYS